MHFIKPNPANVIKDVAGNTCLSQGAIYTGGVSPNVNAAATYAYLDVDGNGRIDHIRIWATQSLRDPSFQTAVWTSATLTTPARNNYQLATGLTGDDAITEVNDQFFFVSFNEGASPDTNVSMTISAPVSGGQKFAADWRADPTLSSTPTFSVGLLAAPSATVVADKAAPIIVSAETVDANVDGFIDGIQITFSESVMDSTVFTADFSITSPAYTATSVNTGSAANDGVVTLIVTPGTTHDGGARPTVTYTRTVSRLTDLAGNALVTGKPGATAQAVDGVVPVLLSATSVPVSTLLTITFSEPVTGSGVAGVLTVADFDYHDGNMGGATQLVSMAENNGNDGIVEGTVQPNFAQSDFDGLTAGDSINAKAGQIHDVNGNAVSATPVALVGPSAAFQVGIAAWLCVMLAALSVLST